MWFSSDQTWPHSEDMLQYGLKITILSALASIRRWISWIYEATACFSTSRMASAVRKKSIWCQLPDFKHQEFCFGWICVAAFVHLSHHYLTICEFAAFTVVSLTPIRHSREMIGGAVGTRQWRVIPAKFGAAYTPLAIMPGTSVRVNEFIARLSRGRDGKS